MLCNSSSDDLAVGGVVEVGADGYITNIPQVYRVVEVGADGYNVTSIPQVYRVVEVGADGYITNIYHRYTE